MANRKSFYGYTNTPPHPPSLHPRAKNITPPNPLQTACAGPWETLTARLSIYIASNRKPNRPSRKHYRYGKPRRHRILRGARRSGLGNQPHWLGGGYFILIDRHAGFIHYSRVFGSKQSKVLPQFSLGQPPQVSPGQNIANELVQETLRFSSYQMKCFAGQRYYVLKSPERQGT